MDHVAQEGPWCHLCGGPTTSSQLLKDSTFPRRDNSNDKDNEEGESEADYETFIDECNCGTLDPDRQMHFEDCDTLKGYDASVVSLTDIEWLDNVRMLAAHVPGIKGVPSQPSGDDGPSAPSGHGDEPKKEELPLSQEDDPEASQGTLVEPKGHLFHEACLDMLEEVHQKTNFVSGSRGLDLREVLLLYEKHAHLSHEETVNWGYGDSFRGERRLRGYMSWNPVKESEWTVMDPRGPIDLSFVIDAASRASHNGLPPEFTSIEEPIDETAYQTANEVFSALPLELKLQILDMLSTQSVLRLFEASSSFNELRTRLPTSFWRSRLFFEAPWCAGMVLAQTSGQSRDALFYHQLSEELKWTSRVGKWETIDQYGRATEKFRKECMGLRKRRQIWYNCESILQWVDMARLSDKSRASL